MGLASGLLPGLLVGCPSGYRDDLDYSYNVEQTWDVKEIESGQLIQFENVPLDLLASVTICQALIEDQMAARRDVLNLRCGTGLIAVLCLLGDAKSVTATDQHPAAVANTRYNVAALASAGTVDARTIASNSFDAFAGIKPTEKFDLILLEMDVEIDPIDDSPQGDDPLCDSFTAGLANHLHPGGRGIVICRLRSTIKLLEQAVNAHGLAMKSLDDAFEDRDWKTLSSVFTPAMLFEIRHGTPDSGLVAPAAGG